MAELFPDKVAREASDWSTLPLDPVIEAYKKDVDRTLLRENLKLTMQQRFEKFVKFMEFVEGIRGAARRHSQDDTVR